MDLSADLLRQTNALFSDRLLRLDVLRESGNTGFKPALDASQREAAGDPVKTCQLAQWQIPKTGPAEALAWMQTLPPDTRTNRQVALLIAQCQISTKNWQGPQALPSKKQNWAEFEFLRHAFRARALRAQGLTGAGKSEWEQAINAASDRKESKILLAQTAAQWDWPGETEDLLWSIANQYPGEKWATTALARHLLAGGQTRPLMALYGLEVKRDPADLTARNNLAMTALLVNAVDVKPHEAGARGMPKIPREHFFYLHLRLLAASSRKALKR